jgi:nucleoid-associated protein YgaU
MNTTVVAGGDLFRLALRHLGDATQWNRIAALNGLDDPLLTGLVKLLLPNVDKSAGGGIAK